MELRLFISNSYDGNKNKYRGGLIVGVTGEGLELVEKVFKDGETLHIWIVNRNEIKGKVGSFKKEQLKTAFEIIEHLEDMIDIHEFANECIVKENEMLKERVEELENRIEQLEYDEDY